MPSAEGNYKCGKPLFCTTQWTVVFNARRPGPEAWKALERLCEAYWYPLYSFIRRKGKSPEDAEDLAQAFFEHLLGGDRFASVDAAKGKFRTFLLVSLVNFMSNERNRANCAKRGGGVRVLSIDAEDAEGRYLVEPADPITPELLFERSWAETVIARVARQLKMEYEGANEGPRFEKLKEFLMDESETPYLAIGAELGLTEGGVKTCVRRLRLRFRDLLREELGATLEDPGEVDAEIRHLLLALAR